MTNVLFEALKSQMETAEDPMQKSFAGLMHFAADGDPFDMQKTLADFPIKLASVKDFARNAIASA